MKSMATKQLRVGIVGAGEVAQVIHLPILALLSHLYVTTSVADLSKKNVEHCAAKFNIPHATTDVHEVLRSPNVDVVFILTSDDSHEMYAIAALEAKKHVMIEKPLSLSLASVQRILAAEAQADGPKIFVGYMRRYATSFNQTFKRELATIPRILYARCRDFSGPNAKFVAESGTFQVKNTDFPAGSAEERDKRLDALYREASGDTAITPEWINYCRFLGSLGSHDISLLREALGAPESVAGVSVNHPFYSAIFNYRNSSGEPFSVTYESGIDGVPDFDAHLAVYGEKKRILIKYDSPYIKGLPIKVVVQEMNEHGEMETREVIGSYEDAYTSEMQDLYDCLVNGKAIKTTCRDALQDLKIFDMMYAQWRGQTQLTNGVKDHCQKS